MILKLDVLQLITALRLHAQLEPVAIIPAALINAHVPPELSENLTSNIKI